MRRQRELKVEEGEMDILVAALGRYLDALRRSVYSGLTYAERQRALSEVARATRLKRKLDRS